MTPSIHGQELSIGDHLGAHTVPDCCDEKMTAGPLNLGYRDYTCSNCKTILEVSPLGLVFDIRT